MSDFATKPTLDERHYLLNLYSKIRPDIEARLEEFNSAWETGTNEDMFVELAFCLFTPQSKARSCWSTVQELLHDGTLWNGNAEELSQRMNRVRFRNNKARYLIEAREKYVGEDKPCLKSLLEKHSTPTKKRQWLVSNIKGMGQKEATHFLRNIGQSGDMAMLDRHILKNLEIFGVLDKKPTSLTQRSYHDIESKMTQFSKEIGIPMDHLDLLLWYKEAGEIFK